ncbi:hypothetical protein, partial [Clostridium sp.]|uniref:hypothetical protein n=1 Tax=Clostridium sp. TaxID=1506 RepID=UPI0028515310
ASLTLYLYCNGHMVSITSPSSTYNTATSATNFTSTNALPIAYRPKNANATILFPIWDNSSAMTIGIVEIHTDGYIVMRPLNSTVFTGSGNTGFGNYTISFASM